jgi:hypothetical protein
MQLQITTQADIDEVLELHNRYQIDDIASFEFNANRYGELAFLKRAGHESGTISV